MKRGTGSKAQSPAAEVRSQEAAVKLDMAGLAEHMKEVLEIASHTADHAELREVIAILETLRDEGIRDLEGLKDYIFDYTLANQQNKAMQEKYCKPAKVKRYGSAVLCPECNATVYHWMKNCGKCGKAIST